MAVQKQYADQPFQFVGTEEQHRVVEEIAAAENVSKASVLRDMVGHALAWRLRVSAKRLGRG